ncbi:Alpha-N-acetylgalactosaminidase [Pirellulimonas nuda]|uniref:Alpha-N-acetylgalactosaminidase n=1 Tax=Pirellulimonas nuda TaxID=2528009 RepID=A0A518DJN6_9BACT|nr:Gfo/Idh/MocA family oxidoreductase [Pirellulimonas nuda]QDU91652.1 Alpha-N-acetylgalactosaminidase [Pirellulimonas nuda]
MPATRRVFLQSSAAAVAASAIAAPARTDANSTIRAAVLGLHGRGRTHVEHLERVPGVEVAVLCDPDEVVLRKAAEDFEKKYGRKVATETDLRKVNDRKDVDVVSVATPNHWHTLATIWACQAGKDVYVEKPGSHNLFEGRKMIEAAKRYDRIVQHGVQLRSNPALQEAVQKMRDGVIGDVYLARGLVYRRRPSIGNKPNATPPKTLNWDLWQGPAQERPYSERYVHYNWHWHWDYGNGDVANQGVHETDMCLWGLGVGLPDEVQAMGGKFLWDDDKETPELLSSCFKYRDAKKMIEFEVRPWDTNDEQGVGVGNLFYGTEGYLAVNGYNGYKTFLGAKREPGPSGSEGDPLGRHFKNFIDAVRSRDASSLNGPVETAHTSSALAHLGNISYRLGRRLEFNPKTETFVGDPEADAMLTRQYREPYVVPEVV